MFSCFGTKTKKHKKEENYDNIEEELKNSEDLLQQ
jgi:hypothetical protein